MCDFRGGALLMALVMYMSCMPPSNQVKVERSVFLMGTMAHFAVEASDRQRALSQLEEMVRTIEDVEAEISTWRDSSLFGQLNHSLIGDSMPLTQRSCMWLERVAYWWDQSDGAFDPAIGSLIEAWGLRGTGQRPNPEDLQNILERGSFDAINLDTDDCLITRLRDVLLDAGGFGKGAAIDAVYQISKEEMAAWMIDFGGHVAVRRGTWEMSLAHPMLRSKPILKFDLTEGSLATSGGSERDLMLGDSTFIGHILHPQTGLPVQWPGSVTAWSTSALDADILSTALYVMGAVEGFDWAVKQNLAACFLILEQDGRVTVKSTPSFEERFGISSDTLL